MASLFLSRKAVEEAMAVITPAIEAAIDLGLLHRSTYHVAVADRSVTDFDKAIVFEHSANLEQWAHPFDQIARSKAQVSWRTGLPTHLVQASPAWLQAGETRWSGSAVEGPIVVAVSGFKPWLDLAVSSWIAAAIQGVIQDKFQREIVPDGAIDFLPWLIT